MSTTRLTFGSILGAVNTAATTVSSTIAVVGTAAETLHGYVQSASAKHNVRQRIDDDLWLSDYLDQRSIELVEAKEQTEKWIALNPTREAKFNAVRETLAKSADKVLGLDSKQP